MSDRMSLEQAKTFATGYGTSMVNEVRAARTIVAVGDALDTLQQEVDTTSYRPRYDEGMVYAIRAIRQAIEATDE